MARDPSKTVDFAPAWLNFNNSNKKKTERSPGTITVNNVPPKSHEPLYKCSSGNRDSVSPSRSGNFWGHPSPASRINSHHQSFNFGDYSSKKVVFHVSPGRDTKYAHSKPNVFSNTCSHISKKDGSYQYMYANNWNRCLQYKTSDDKSPRLDTDFPSLSDMDISDNTRGRSSQASATVTNMWSKPLRLKATSNQNSNEGSFGKSQATASIYKNLVPKSSSSNQKQSYRRTMSVPLNLPSKSPLKASEEMIVPRTKRDLGDSPHLQQQKLLDAQRCGSRPIKLESTGSGKKYTSGIGVVSGHKKHRKGKTEFLNTLRQEEEGDSAGRFTPSANVSDKDLPEQECPSAHSLFDNGNINDGISSCSEERRERGSENRGKMELGSGDNEVNRRIKSWNSSFDHLSSSLEAEHRLLREMGWQYTDDQEIEEEPLTEDEIREFFSQNKQNGLLTVPSANHREEAFHSAISEWKFSGIRRKHNQNGSSENFNAILSTGDHDISSSDEF